MTLDSKVAQLAKIAADLRKKLTQLEEKRRPNTPPKFLARKKCTTTQAAKRIEENKTCAKAMDQVSQTWEAKKSQMIACELTMFEANITQIRNNMKQICLAQNKVKETEL